MPSYSDTIEIKSYETLGAIDELVENLRGYGTAVFNYDQRSLLFGGVEEDLWALRGAVDEMLRVLDAAGYQVDLDRAKVVG